MTRPPKSAPRASKGVRARYLSRLISRHNTRLIRVPSAVREISSSSAIRPRARDAPRYRATTGCRLTNSAYLATRNAISRRRCRCASTGAYRRLSINLASMGVLCHCDRDSRMLGMHMTNGVTYAVKRARAYATVLRNARFRRDLYLSLVR